MATGLNVGRLVNVTVDLSPVATARRGFGVLLLMGDSDVIPLTERLRTYTTIDALAGDFGVASPEYAAALLYFSQSPKPKTLMVGRVSLEKTPAILQGGFLNDAAQKIAEWNVIQDGTLTVRINGADVKIENLDFSSETNLNGVASKITDAATAQGFTCEFDGTCFTIKTTATGAAAQIAYAQPTAGSGTDLADKMLLTEAAAWSVTDGTDGETLLEAVQDAADKSAAWYGLALATKATFTNAEKIALAQYIEAATPARVCGFTETDGRILSAVYETDLASQCKKLSLARTLVTYSQNENAVTSIFGRAFSVNFSANRSVITLMYKQQPSVVAENLTETQAGVLESKNCNVFVNYSNDAAIIQEGKVASGAYFDEIHGLDWLADALQNAIWNLLYQSKTKIPQTDDGQNQILNACASVCEEGVKNGLIAAGTWNSDGFGELERGQYLDAGYYLYSEPMADQDQSEREQRKAPPIQIAVKLAGAIHTVDVAVSVNR
jgi:hypothetical protein